MVNVSIPTRILSPRWGDVRIQCNPLFYNIGDEYACRGKWKFGDSLVLYPHPVPCLFYRG